MDFVRHTLLYVLCLFYLAMYILGAIITLPLVIAVMLMFRLFPVVCAFIAYPFLYLTERLCGRDYQQLKFKAGLSYTMKRIQEDWVIIRRDFLGWN